MFTSSFLDVNIKPFLENEKDSFKWYVSAALEKLHYEKSVPGKNNFYFWLKVL